MPIDRKSKCKNGTFIQPVASLKTFIKTNNLTDIWRKFNQDKQQFTWHSTSCSIELLIFQ
jgi:exonuclease III